jgi:hypothetical protein
MNTVNRIVFSIVLFNVLVNAEPLQLLFDWNAPAIQDQWNVYGAYFELDETCLEMSERGFAKKPSYRIYVNKRIKIITRDGIDYGTVYVKPYSDIVEYFKVAVYDSSNNAVFIDKNELKKQYYQTGKIVCPNVTVGSTIEIQLIFFADELCDYFTFYYSRAIPVHTSRFYFECPFSYKYDTKAYSYIDTVKEFNEGKRIGKEWVITDYLPVSQIDSDKRKMFLQRIELILRKKRKKEIFNSWVAVLNYYTKSLNLNIAERVSSDVIKLVNYITKNDKTDSVRVNTILQWVKEEISLDNENGYNINSLETMHKKSGTTENIISLLANMYKAAGFSTDIILTCPVEFGGFDTGFVSMSTLVDPLVCIKYDKQKLICNPFLPGSIPGDYQESFFGQSGISLTTQKIEILPEPNSSKADIKRKFCITADPESVSTDISIDYNGYSALIFRNELLHSDDNTIREAFQKLMTTTGTSNAISNFKIMNLNQLNKPIHASMKIYNDNAVLIVKNNLQIAMDYMFNQFFSDYDTNRTSPYITSCDTKYVIEGRVIVEKKGIFTHAIPAISVENELFSASVVTKDIENGIQVELLIEVRKGEFSVETMKKIYIDIQKLNEIEKSTVTITF